MIYESLLIAQDSPQQNGDSSPTPNPSSMVPSYGVQGGSLEEEREREGGERGGRERGEREREREISTVIEKT